MDPERIQRNLEINPPVSYPQSVLKQIYLLSAQKPHRQPKARIFGSYIYRFQKYPGDIDVMENFDCESCHSENDVVKKFFIALKKIINNVLKQKEEYYSEIKCGIDERYNLDIGLPIEGVWYPPKELLDEIFNLYNSALLEKKEFNMLKNILSRKGSHDSNEYDVVKYILRNHYILRWTAEEVLKNEKILPGNVKFKFTDGLRMDSLVKIDVITIINTRVVETTNVYYLAYKDGDVFHHLQSSNVIEGLKDEIEKLYYSDMFYSPFKMVKRIYAFCRGSYISIDRGYKDDPFDFKQSYEYVLNQIIPFLGGDVSFLYQLRSELDTIVLLLEKFKNPAKKAIFNTIDEMKIRISKILFFNDAYVNNLCSLLDYANAQKNNEAKIEILEEVMDEMKRVINYKTITFLESVNLNPPAHFLLPNPIIYRNNIRGPNDDPINPLKLVSGGYSCGCGEGYEEKENKAKELLSHLLKNR